MLKHHQSNIGGVQKVTYIAAMLAKDIGFFIELLHSIFPLHATQSMGQLRADNSIERARDSPNEEFLLSENERSQEGKPQEATARPRTTTYKSWVQDWWLVEVVSLLVGTVTSIAIYIVLRHYQNQPAPEVNLFGRVGITLNTIIAILSTASRVCLPFPVAECISQQKWAWFSGSTKPLTELETFDRGGRGAFGSLVLLWRINVRYSTYSVARWG
jgi:hypothetical protein